MIEYCNNFKGENDIYTDEEMLASFFKRSRENAIQYFSPLYCYQMNLTNTDIDPIIKDFWHIKVLHLSVQAKPWIYGKRYVENFTPNWYIGRFFYTYYIDVLNQGIEELNEKGFNIALVE